VEPVRGAVALALLLAAASAARAAEPPPAALDAEMLRDLDMLGSPTYARDRELSKRLRLIERLRMLEAMRQAEADAAGAPVPAARPSSSTTIPPSIPPTNSLSNPKEVK
jgi:hypothetical protein